jgi:hypothetical protein
MVFALKKKREIESKFTRGEGKGCDVALLYRCSTVKVPLPCFVSVFSVIWSEEIRPREALWLVQVNEV